MHVHVVISSTVGPFLVQYIFMNPVSPISLTVLSQYIFIHPISPKSTDSYDFILFKASRFSDIYQHLMMTNLYNLVKALTNKNQM